MVLFCKTYGMRSLLSGRCDDPGVFGERGLFWLTAVRAAAAMMLPVIMIHFPRGNQLSEGGANPM